VPHVTLAQQDHEADGTPTMVAQLSDLHLRAGEEGAGAAQRLRQALRLLAGVRPQPSAVLVSGDIADVPSPEVYDHAHDMLSELGLPLHVIPGNHDDRDLLRARFGTAPAPAGAPMHFSATCGRLRVVGCDSTVPGSGAGALSADELDWLARQLSSEPQTPTLLALHHPPVLTGLRMMDAIALAPAGRAALEDLLRDHTQVLAVTCGHVHTSMASSFAGRPVLICPSTNSTVRLDLRPREDLPFEVSGQPVGLLVHALVDDRLLSHFQPFDPPALL
jgi:3',5'-cyclic AMP phosphodiesterase CpdA